MTSRMTASLVTGTETDTTGASSRQSCVEFSFSQAVVPMGSAVILPTVTGTSGVSGRDLESGEEQESPGSQVTT